ncbi:hypothetical protein [Xanthomonas cassavae]|uniref:hypothetical protein n=1 Tax=Xanthomonas cassavae TaxID=56450 RepID=UPI0003F943A1|nr:hypothetical protein [Xanthomonas cassavae]
MRILRGTGEVADIAQQYMGRAINDALSIGCMLPGRQQRLHLASRQRHRARAIGQDSRYP